MKKAFLLLASVAALYSLPAPIQAQEQACQWNIQNINGVATATYCGNVVVNGTINGGGTAGNLTGPITSVGLATSVASQTGTGSTFVMNTSPVLITPNIGTPSAGVATNLTGTAAGLTAGHVTINANLTGVITSSGNATVVGAQTGTGSTFVMNTSPVLITPNIGTPSAGVATNLTGTAAGLTAGSVTTIPNLTGPITSSGNVTSIGAQTGTGSTFVVQTSPTINTPTFTAPVLGTPASGVATNLTGTAAGMTAGSVITNANLTGPITSTGNATAVAAQTGTGSTFVMQTSPTINTPTFTAPALGTPASGVLTNATGSAAGLTAGSVITNANLTGVITSVGNATSIASQTGTGTQFVMSASPTLTGTLTAPIISSATSITLTSNNVKMTAPSYFANGSAPTGTGTCAISSQTGGTTVGKFVNTSTCTAGTIILTFGSITATNGWSCGATDITTPADTLNQTGFTTTTATFTGTLVASDVILFRCMGF